MAPPGGTASARLKSSGCSHGRCACGKDPRSPGSSPRSRYSRNAAGRYGSRTRAELQLLWTSQSIISALLCRPHGDMATISRRSSRLQPGPPLQFVQVDAAADVARERVARRVVVPRGEPALGEAAHDEPPLALAGQDGAVERLEVPAGRDLGAQLVADRGVRWVGGQV